MMNAGDKKARREVLVAARVAPAFASDDGAEEPIHFDHRDNMT